MLFMFTFAEVGFCWAFPEIFLLYQHLSYSGWAFLVLLTDGGGTKRLPPKNMSQICYNDETHTSSKEEIENIWITWHTHWILPISAFFHWKFFIKKNRACFFPHNFMITILMMPVQLITDYGLTNKFLSNDLNCNLNAVMSP